MVVELRRLWFLLLEPQWLVLEWAAARFVGVGRGERRGVCVPRAAGVFAWAFQASRERDGVLEVTVPRGRPSAIWLVGQTALSSACIPRISHCKDILFHRILFGQNTKRLRFLMALPAMLEAVTKLVSRISELIIAHQIRFFNLSGSEGVL